MDLINRHVIALISRFEVDFVENFVVLVDSLDIDFALYLIDNF